tara:strand:+ start:1011 stop:1343 length:333 start_codon:yes stop_codon:yes gene_type:complete
MSKFWEPYFLVPASFVLVPYLTWTHDVDITRTLASDGIRTVGALTTDGGIMPRLESSSRMMMFMQDPRLEHLTRLGIARAVEPCDNAHDLLFRVDAGWALPNNHSQNSKA